MLKVNKLNYCYVDDRYVLRDINITISRGEKVALVGPNGAGKTTLLLHLNGILRGTGGISVGDLELNGKTIKSIRSKIGLVFQSPDDQLFSSSVYEDVAYGLVYQGLPKSVIEKRVKEALSAVGMAGFEERVPYHLSLGEKKRVALAAVLSMRPEILVLDEPASGLDPRGRREIINLLAGFDQTILAATHDLAMAAEIFPRMLVMDEGCLAYDGPTEAALKDNELLLKHGLAA